MHSYTLFFVASLAFLFDGVQNVGFAQESQPPQSPSTVPSSPAPEKFIGAPQVLEIPPQQRQTHQNEQPVVDDIPPLSSVQPTYQPTYLGLRYATADTCLYMELTRGDSTARQEECLMDTDDSSETQPEGIKVLSVIAGSPGERAGFEGADAPASAKDRLVKVGIAILALSPAGPLAIPLAMAYDAYTGRHIPGDLITGVDGTQVRTAQEFNAAMSRYQPGTAVTFTVMRAGEPLRLTAQLEAESGLK